MYFVSKRITEVKSFVTIDHGWEFFEYPFKFKHKTKQ